MGQINRREFIARNFEGAAMAGACLCGLSGCATFTKVGATPALPAGACAIEPGRKVTVFLKKAPALASVGGSVKIVDPALPEPLIVARVDRGRFAVVSLHCPHRGVELEYQAAQKQFRCASLGHSKFALDGSKLGGPAPRAVKTYAASVQADNLVIRL
ncbi:MAG TPA: Rieske 2Fe-2S domain-containing protein [Verrucomicrobiae bacterium]|nr:Rieske 2Fe-2S domain-containing protein [Verrucomicrobiae bacterium]